MCRCRECVDVGSPCRCRECVGVRSVCMGAGAIMIITMLILILLNAAGLDVTTLV